MLGPGADGATLAAGLAAERPELSVILVSGYPQTHFDLSALPAGFQFLAKPFALASLRGCLAAAVAARA